MLNWLIDVGRSLIVVGAVAMVAIGGFWGWLASYHFGGNSDGQFVGIVGGAVAGFIAAGATFGVIAAIFDIQASLRQIAQSGRSLGSTESQFPPR